jgi:hypothetical protein
MDSKRRKRPMVYARSKRIYAQWNSALWPRVARQITGTRCIIKMFLSRSLGEAFMLQKLSKDFLT